MGTADRYPAWRGAATALLAALLFGASTPAVQHFGAGLSAFATAALLYAGAAAVGALSSRPSSREAGLRRSDLPRLLALAGCGAVAGPVALAWGLQHTSATSASLLLTLEVVFTAAFAAIAYREAIDRRVGTAMVLLVIGGLLVGLDSANRGSAAVGLGGLLAVALATAAWGLDNTLSRALAERDPGQVVLVKSVLGAAATGALAMAVGEPLPTASAALGLVAVGATGYGLSLRLYLLAQRAFGAARTGSVFAFAPFIGAAVAVALGDRGAGGWLVAGGATMLAGIGLHLAERHSHLHVHDPLDHEHAHRHDEGHHDHRHDPMPVGAHSHPHSHRPLRHAHAHVPDAHHTHTHGHPQPHAHPHGPDA